MPTVVEQLRAALGADAVLVGRDVAARAASWIDPSPLEAAALVRPRTTEQVAAALRICNAAGQGVITRGGATNLVDATHSTPAATPAAIASCPSERWLVPLTRFCRNSS